MVISTVNRVVYNGDGITTAWPYTFRIIDATDIKLTIVDADGAETQVTADYYVDTINNTVYYPGYAPGAEPPAEDQPPKLQEGQKIIVYRQLPVNQLANLGDKWPFAVIEKGLDKLTMLIQDWRDMLSRCLRISIGQSVDAGSDFDPTVPLEAGKVIKGNAAGTGFEAAKALLYKNDGWNAEGAPIRNVGYPNNDDDAANKDYVNQLINDYVYQHPEIVLGDATYKGQQEIAAAINNITLSLMQGTAPVFSNVASMKQADLVVGNSAVTKGYYAVNDGGGGLYTIRAKTAEDVVDNGSIIELDNGNVAELITDGTVCPEQFGAYGDGVHDDTDALVKALSFCKVIVFKANATYNVQGLYVPNLSNKILIGNNATIKYYLDNAETLLNHQKNVLSNYDSLSSADTSFDNGYIVFRHLNFDGNASSFTSVDTSNWLNGIALRNYESVVIENCSVRNTLNAGFRLNFCNNVSVVDSYFEDICLYRYTRDSFVGEGVTAIGAFNINGSTSNRVYRVCNSLYVSGCTFINCFDSPACGKNYKSQIIVGNNIRNCRRITEPNFVTDFDGDEDCVRSFVLKNNTVDTFVGPIISAQENYKAGMKANFEISGNVFSNINGLPATTYDTSKSSLFFFLASNWIGSAGSTDIDIKIENNIFNFASSGERSNASALFSIGGGIRNFSVNNNIFNNISITTGTFITIQGANTKIEFKDNALGIKSSFGESFCIFNSNKLEVENNTFSWLNDGNTTNHLFEIRYSSDNTDGGYLILCNNYFDKFCYSSLAKFTSFCDKIRCSSNTIINSSSNTRGNLFATNITADGAITIPYMLFMTENVAKGHNLNDNIFPSISRFVNVNNSFSG